MSVPKGRIKRGVCGEPHGESSGTILVASTPVELVKRTAFYLIAIRELATQTTNRG